MNWPRKFFGLRQDHRKRGRKSCRWLARIRSLRQEEMLRDDKEVLSVVGEMERQGVEWSLGTSARGPCRLRGCFRFSGEPDGETSWDAGHLRVTRVAVQKDCLTHELKQVCVGVPALASSCQRLRGWLRRLQWWILQKPRKWEVASPKEPLQWNTGRCQRCKLWTSLLLSALEDATHGEMLLGKPMRAWAGRDP